MPQNDRKTEPAALLVQVAARGKGEKAAAPLAARSAWLQIIALGRGTADSTLLACLGLSDSRRDILLCALPLAQAREALRAQKAQRLLCGPGEGISFFIAANDWEKYRRAGTDAAPKQEEAAMEHAYGLIAAVCSQGYADEVFETAKAAGAAGGTILHARDVGGSPELFFGISIQPERELLLILSRADDCASILRAVRGWKPPQADAQVFALCLPVEDAAGLPGTC